MTTIAWDGRMLASDTQASSRDVVCSLKEKKIFTPPDAGWSIYGEPIKALGCAGDCGAEMELQNLMVRGLTYASEFMPTFEFAAIAVVSAERAYVISKNKDDVRANISLQTEPYAVGSGGIIARVVMYCGKSARDAVAVAIKMDCFSGGSVEAFTMPQEAGASS